MADFVQAHIERVEGKKKGEKVHLTFNPETVSFSKSVAWTKTLINSKDVPDLDFAGGDSGTFKISDVTFDETMPELLAYTKKKGSKDIAKDIERLVGFTKVELFSAKDEKGQSKQVLRPPKCQFVWGTYKSYSVYVKGVSVQYVLFDGNGRPLRAKVSVDFVEAGDKDKLPYQNPTSRSLARKVRTVLEGETLDWIAYQEYGSAAEWRHIAETNNLDDPSDVRAGQVLRLVPLH